MGSDIENALYIVATPIGNLGDITLRAIDVLNSVDIVACEDTRNTSLLFDKYKIKTRLVSYHKFSETKKTDFFLNFLEEGKSVALVSDAGTPLISDPGEILVDEVRKKGYKVIPVCGATAAIALLSAIPRKDEDFKFIGFLPRTKKQIQEIVLKNNNENLVFYESPLRLMDTLEAISEILPEKIIAVGRELTKKFEEILTDNILNTIEYYETNTLKGEIVCMLYKTEIKDSEDYTEQIKKLRELNLKDKEIAKIIAKIYDVNKNAVYKKCLEI